MQSTFDVQRDHEKLLHQAMRLLAEQGILYFSNNLRTFKLGEAIEQQYQVKNISRATLPKDFERNPKIHHCWTLTHR